MKKISIFLLAIAFSVATSVSANNTDPVKETKTAPKISHQLGKLLSDPYFSIENEIEAEVRFMLNKNNEIVVLSVDSDSKLVERYIKARLNYNKIVVGDEEKSNEYKVMVKIQEEV